MSATSQRGETVASFRHGIEVIRSFTREHPRQTISEVAGRTGLSRAAARRLLLTLCEMSLARTDGKHFRLTPAVLAFGQTFLAGMSELEIVRDVLLQYTQEARESASAGVLIESDVIYVTRLASPNNKLPVGTGPGLRRPAHATAIGQILLAEAHPRELDRYLSQAVLEGYTPHTVTDKKALRAKLASIRKQGFATIVEELVVGQSSIAVSVPPGSSGTRMGIASSVPSALVSEAEMIATLLPRLQRAAADIAHLAANG
ncbi:IclR family transcriptional regulator C-terminal domain-containing protein [Acidisphaera sp. L21]|uniref:IclR family transcriptional regulator domain-containing protein n=1 Tax=Acidisphaera sp. L21 TaxID=1641851 RepID=UPI00131E11E6|nr:IclR family transcriptional regulator C-terminal domain-containing protein [Acidisphaera sp. L21]